MMDVVAAWAKMEKKGGRKRMGRGGTVNGDGYCYSLAQSIATAKKAPSLGLRMSALTADFFFLPSPSAAMSSALIQSGCFLSQTDSD